MEELVPVWLKQQFPEHLWATLRSCTLRVDSEIGAGLDTEASDVGFVVDDIEERPGQDPAIRVGDVIIAIAGVRLQGLAEAELQATFGKHLCDGVKVLLVSADELRTASIESEKNEKCSCEIEIDQDDMRPEDTANYELLRRQKSSTECEATVRIPVGRSTQWRLDQDTMTMLEGDLQHLGERFGLSAQPHFSRDGGMDAVVLKGLSTAIANARSEVTQVLAFYRERYCNGAMSNADAVTEAGLCRDGSSVEEDVFEVDGLFLQSRPARERRVRRKVDSTETELRLSPPVGQQADDGVTTAPCETEPLAGDYKELRQFEYMDHTADVILHSWGRTLEEAFAQVCVAFFGYLTELDTVDIVSDVEVEATGHDVLDLLYHLLDEFLFSFGTGLVVCRHVSILELDMKTFRVRARGKGERFDLKKHPQGTEIKAITMHQMKILTPDSLTTEEGIVARKQSAMEGGCKKEGFPFECYVLVDI